MALVRGGRSIPEVARDLGVSQWSLNLWVKSVQSGRAFRDSKTLVRPNRLKQRELRRLRQQNDCLRRQRDIFKKALGILSAEMPA